MRVLILSCNTGEGHNSTARAIAEVMKQRGMDCFILDALSMWSAKLSRFVCNWHVRIYRGAPRLFNMGYKMLEHQPSDPGDEGPLYEVFSKGAAPLYQLIQENRFDAVICTHVFAAMILTEVKRRFDLPLPTAFVETDYTCQPYTEQTDMDAYFIPDERLMTEFIARGIDGSRLITTGIPVRQGFYAKSDRRLARQALGLPQNKRILLCMSGSMGAGPIRKLVKDVAENLPENAMAVCICGSNKKLYDDLSKLAGEGKLRVVGFTRDVPLYMDASDLMLTKPGGLSSTEAAAKRLPLVFANVVGGCEARNLEFFCRYEYAKTAGSAEELAKLSCRLLEDPDTTDQMAARLETGFRHNGAVEICDYLEKMVACSTKE